MQAKRVFGGVLVIMGMGLAVPGVGRAAPTTVEYPSTTCPVADDHGLQDCIDAVDPGSTIILNTEIIEEGASIDKSLTLRATDRTLRPVILGVLVGSPSTGAATITIQDIRFSIGAFVTLTTGSGHTVTFRRIEAGSGFFPKRGMSVTSNVPATIAIENSIIRRVEESDVLELTANNSTGRVRFRIIGNRITAKGDPKSGAGIAVRPQGRGAVLADIFNNVITDVGACACGTASGITVLPEQKAVANVNIVGNTIEGTGGYGIDQRNDLTTGKLSLDIFNNIFTHNSFGTIGLTNGPAGSLVLRAGFNDFFANGPNENFEGHPRGPGNLNVNPRYVDRAGRNLRLTSNSPLIDKGSTCSPGGVANSDAAGHHRLRGPAVDIGAYENGGPEITGVVLLGTSGPDTLIGTGGRDILCGYGGDDTLSGRAGPDYIDGGSGKDHVSGGADVDRVLGSFGDDVLCTKDGTNGDIADGGPGNDKAVTDAGDTRISIEASGGNC